MWTFVRLGEEFAETYRRGAHQVNNLRMQILRPHVPTKRYLLFIYLPKSVGRLGPVSWELYRYDKFNSLIQFGLGAW